MKKILPLIIFFAPLLASSTPVSTSPLGLEWKKSHAKPPSIKKYQLYYGDIAWGKVIYLGTSKILELETEIQLKFDSQVLTSATLILGPSGINSFNCHRKYKRVVGIFNNKYGNYSLQRIKTDPILEDLVQLSACTKVISGAYQIDTVWSTPTHKIVATMFGDSEGIYIEIEYADLKNTKKSNQANTKKYSKEI